MDKVKTLLKKLETVSGENKVTTLNDLAFALYNTEPENTEKYAKQALALAKEINSQSGIARSYNVIGVSFHQRGDFKKAMKYYLKSLNIFIEIGDEQKIASAKHNIGSINEKLSNFSLALEYYLQALKIWKKIDDKQHLSATYNNIGIIHEKQGSNDLALEYHLKSLKIKEEIDDKYGASISYVNLGIVYVNQNNYDKALESNSNAVKIKKEIGDTRGLAASYLNFGSIYSELTKDDKALKYLLKALEAFEKIEDKYGIAATKTSIGKVHLVLKDYDISYKYLTDSLELANKIGANGLEANASIALSELFERQSNFKKALKYSKKHHNLRNDIFNEQKSKQISEMQIKYDIDAKEKETEIFKLKNIELANEIANHKKTENELLKERNFAEGLIDTAQAIILVLDEEGKIIKFNPFLEKLSGYTLEEMKGKDWFSNFLPPSNIEKIKLQFKTAINDVQSQGIVDSIVTKNGNLLSIEWFDKTLKDNNGKTIGLLAIGRDITKSIKADENLHNSKILLKKVSSILRHDIINNLVVIKSALKIYRNSSSEEMLDEIGKRVKDSVGIIQRQRKQESFIDVYSHLDEYCIEDILEQITKSYKNTTINVTGKSCVYADNAIYAVFENLIDNSITHGKTKKIDIEIINNEDNCMIKFTDFGVGIPDNIKSTVFVEGFDHGKTGHSGFGLHFVKNAIDEYGGTIWIEDNKPKGVVFVMNLRSVIHR